MLIDWDGDYKNAINFDYDQFFRDDEAYQLTLENKEIKWFINDIFGELYSKAIDEQGYYDLESIPITELLFKFITEC